MGATPARTVCSTCGRVFIEGERFCPDDGSDLRPERVVGDDPLVGTLLGGSYTILSKLGGGGMGVVYRARQNRLQRDVAVKILSTALAADKAAEDRFRTEALAVSQLSNAHTVAIYDFGATDDGRVYLVMQLVEGESLRARIQRGPLSVRAAIAIASQILESLGEAHERRPQIIHRDVKPDNIIVRVTTGGEEFATVLDFGLAKLADTERMTATGLIIGTPAYMAPEQARNEERLDGRVDLYALGVVLYEMLGGRPPFAASSAAALLYKHVWDPPPPFKVTLPGLELPKALEGLVFELLAKNPDDRPPTASAVRGRLQEIQRQLPQNQGWVAAKRTVDPQLTAGFTPAPLAAVPRTPRASNPAQPRPAHDTITETNPASGKSRGPLIAGMVALLLVLGGWVVYSNAATDRAANERGNASTATLGASAATTATAPTPAPAPPPPAPVAQVVPPPAPVPANTELELPVPAVHAEAHPTVATEPPAPEKTEPRTHSRHPPPRTSTPGPAAKPPAGGEDFPIVPM